MFHTSESPHGYLYVHVCIHTHFRGLCMLPKGACDFNSAEVAKIMRLCQNSSGNAFVETVTFTVCGVCSVSCAYVCMNVCMCINVATFYAYA